jgi:transposase-like protein
MVLAVLNGGLSQAETARAFNTTPKTVGKWLVRYRTGGLEALRDRSSRPHASPSRTPPATCEQVESLRRERRTQAAMAGELGLSPATVSRILARRGLSRLSALEAATPRPRYERDGPGEIIHIDIKKLGKFQRTGHRITAGTGAATAKAAASAGSLPMSPSTTTLASPASTSCPTRRRPAPSPS